MLGNHCSFPPYGRTDGSHARRFAPAAASCRDLHAAGSRPTMALVRLERWALKQAFRAVTLKISVGRLVAYNRLAWLHRTHGRTVRFSCGFHPPMRHCKAYTTVYGLLQSTRSIEQNTASEPMSRIPLPRVGTHWFSTPHGRTDGPIFKPFALPDASPLGQHDDIWHVPIVRGTCQKGRKKPKSREANMGSTILSLPRTDERTSRFSRRLHCQMRLIWANTTTYGTSRSFQAPARNVGKSQSRARQTWGVPFFRYLARTNGQADFHAVCTARRVSACPIRRYVPCCRTPRDRRAKSKKPNVAHGKRTR